MGNQFNIGPRSTAEMVLRYCQDSAPSITFLVVKSISHVSVATHLVLYATTLDENEEGGNNLGVPKNLAPLSRRDLLGCARWSEPIAFLPLVWAMFQKSNIHDTSAMTVHIPLCRRAVPRVTAEIMKILRIATVPDVTELLGSRCSSSDSRYPEPSEMHNRGS